jgi:hypothetical protein
MTGKLGQRLRDASRSGVYRVSGAPVVLQEAHASRLDVARIEARDDVLGRIAQALEFPGWFGRNWDALEDCLGDLSWRHGAGHVLVFDAFPGGDELGVLLDVLRSSAQYWAGRGRPFFAVFVDPRRELGLPDLYREA